VLQFSSKMAERDEASGGVVRGAELSPRDPGKAPLASLEPELNIHLREPDEVLVRPAVRRRTSHSRERGTSKEARRYPPPLPHP
jgi:hypothetical protein